MMILLTGLLAGLLDGVAAVLLFLVAVIGLPAAYMSRWYFQ
jgi:hypothetical protein